jgi:hypothetical protein
MQPIEQVLYGLWLIGMVGILFAFLLQVKRNLQAARLERQRRYLVEILDEVLQISDPSLRSHLLQLWVQVEAEAHQAQSPQVVISALTKSLKEALPLLETLAENNDRSLVLQVIPQIIGIYYTGDLRIRFFVTALTAAILAWLVVRLLQMPILSIVRGSVETVQQLHRLRSRIAASITELPAAS